MLGQARGNVRGFSKPLTGIMSANSTLAKASHITMLRVNTSPTTREKELGWQCDQCTTEYTYEKISFNIMFEMYLSVKKNVTL